MQSATANPPDVAAAGPDGQTSLAAGHPAAAETAPPVCPSVAFTQAPGCPAIPAEVQQALGHTGLPISSLLIGIVMMIIGLRARRAKQRPAEQPNPKPR